MNNYIVYSLSEIEKPVKVLHSLLTQCQVFTFTGSLGAGKTTLIQHLLRACEVKDVIISPTYSYVNIYSNSQSQTFYHFDLYRLHSLAEFYNNGFNEYLYQPQSWSFIEWPSLIMPILTHNVCHITIEYSEDKRLLTYSIE